jgi:hypothetical protein
LGEISKVFTKIILSLQYSHYGRGEDESKNISLQENPPLSPSAAKKGEEYLERLGLDHCPTFSRHDSKERVPSVQ